MLRMDKIDYMRSMGLRVSGIDNRIPKYEYFLKPKNPYASTSIPVGLERIFK